MDSWHDLQSMDTRQSSMYFTADWTKTLWSGYVRRKLLQRNSSLHAGSPSDFIFCRPSCRSTSPYNSSGAKTERVMIGTLDALVTETESGNDKSIQKC